MQQRSGTDRRRAAERNAAQPLGVQPRAGDEDEELQEPERAPSPLSAREFEFGQERRMGERRNAPAGEPMATDAEPPRGRRGTPNPKSDPIQQRRNLPDENT